MSTTCSVKSVSNAPVGYYITPSVGVYYRHVQAPRVSMLVGLASSKCLRRDSFRSSMQVHTFDIGQSAQSAAVVSQSVSRQLALMSKAEEY